MHLFVVQGGCVSGEKPPAGVIVCCAALVNVDSMVDVEVEDEVRTRQKSMSVADRPGERRPMGTSKDVAKDGGE